MTRQANSPQTATRNRRGRRGGYTLVELIVVIGVIAMVLVIVGGGLGGGATAKMNGALADLRTTLSLARQWAITHNSNVHVVFPDVQSLNGGTAQTPVIKALRGYAVYSEKQGGYISDWKLLPEGILFIPYNNFAPGAMFPKISAAKSPLSPSYMTTPSNKRPFPIPPETTRRSVWCLTFTPDGSTENQGTDTEIYLGEGSLMVNEATGQILGQPLYTSTNLWSVEINRFTGQAGKIKDYSDFIK